ncbi:MAG: tRNA-uridine aminocarboxypropyltransferase [Polyangiales bacterium]
MLPVRRVSRRSNVSARCARCHVHASLCICALIPRLETRTRLVLFIHRYEDRKPTNTGRLAAECLVNSEVLVRGHASAPTPRFVPAPGSQPLFLFPIDGATPLTEYVGSLRPVTLIVPDGTWRQAAKVRNRVAGLVDVPCVSLPRGECSRYRLRHEAHVGALATMEAIARAMGVLEGSHIQEAIERVFQAMVDRSLWSRGEIGTADVSCGIPAGVSRHDPRSGDGCRKPAWS